VQSARVPLALLARSPTFRIVLAYLGLFTVCAAILLVLLSWTASVLIEWQVQEIVEAEAGGLADQYRESGIEGLVAAIDRRLAQEDRPGGVYLLVGPDGERVAGNLPVWPAQDPDTGGWIRFEIDRPAEAQPAAEVMARSFQPSNKYQLLVGRSLSDAKAAVHAISRALGLGLALALLLGMLGAVLTGRRQLKRVEAMRETTRRIAGGDLKDRMEASGKRDELDRLASSFNAMMDGLEQTVEDLRPGQGPHASDASDPS